MAKRISNLGLPDELEDIKFEQLKNNETAINMLLHNYRKLEEENLMLKQDLTRQSTIERTLAMRNTYTKVAAIVSVFASLLLSFGVNYVTSDSRDIKGFVLVFLGIIAEIISLFFSFYEEGKND